MHPDRIDNTVLFLLLLLEAPSLPAAFQGSLTRTRCIRITDFESGKICSPDMRPNLIHVLVLLLEVTITSFYGCVAGEV